MLDGLIADGYDQRDTPEGCEAWLKAWQMLQQLGDRLQIHTLREFDERFKGTELLQNWVQDLAMPLGDLARPEQNRDWFQRRVQCCESFLSRFPNEDRPLIQMSSGGWPNPSGALARTIAGTSSFKNGSTRVLAGVDWLGGLLSFRASEPARLGSSRADPAARPGD
jgi:hypothetical protein